MRWRNRRARGRRKRGGNFTRRAFGRIETRPAVNLPVTDVAVCVVQSTDGRVLMAERTARQIAAGFWELPGGKIEPGETAAAAAARELLEETGLQAVGVSPWMTYEHQFQTRRLRLHFFRARGWEGTAHGREGQRLAWVDPRAPNVGPILASNDRALFALGLPPSYLIADFRAKDCPDAFLARLQAELTSGATLIRVRIAAFSPGQTVSLFARVAALADVFPNAHILTPTVMDARRAGLAGVHSCSRELRRLTSRPPVRIWATTCRNETDLARAVSLGADFSVLSPIAAGAERSSDGTGWERLQRTDAALPIGIYARGGAMAGPLMPAAMPAQIPDLEQSVAAGIVMSRIERPPDRSHSAHK
jgi:8-oxo-dGTP diphosphatase